MPPTVAVPESKSLADLERDYEDLCEELTDVRATHRNLRLKRRELYRSKAVKPADLEDVAGALSDLEARIEGLESARSRTSCPRWWLGRCVIGATTSPVPSPRPKSR